MKKFTIIALSALTMSAYAAQSSMPPNEALKIFQISGLGDQAFANEGGFSKKFDPKNLSLEHCIKLDGEKLCATTSIKSATDINGDKQPEIVVIDDAHSTYHYGNTGTAFALLTKTKTGYRLIADGIGIPSFLKTKGKNGYPDLEVGGLGFCFAVLRYNGAQYQYHRREYDGKACD
ncbi:MAG: hypothetical protein Q4A69_03710 [Moraxella sp.]|nr:hypothetical protein [Moraxella sp.]